MGYHDEIVRTEEDLILLLARGTLTLLAETRVRQLLDREISWSFLSERIIEEGVLPLVYRNLRRIDLERVPPGVRAELIAANRSNALHNSLLARQLKIVLNLLAGAKIPAIPLKGLPLAESLYGDTALRVCTDIDILVPRSSVIDALKLLTSNGYASQFRQPFEKSLIMRRGIECSLLREEGPFKYLLEIHWGLFLDAALEKSILADLWSEARPNTFAESPCLALSPEWELLFLAVHAARHQWQGLKWMVDIHEVCLLDTVDWTKLQKKGERFEWDHALRLTLLASRELFETPIPPALALPDRPRWIRLFPSPYYRLGVQLKLGVTHVLASRSLRVCVQRQCGSSSDSTIKDAFSLSKKWGVPHIHTRVLPLLYG